MTNQADSKLAAQNFVWKSSKILNLLYRNYIKGKFSSMLCTSF